MHKDYSFPDLMAAELSALDERLFAVEQRDRHDVQAMADKAQNEERAARVRHIEDVARDLRAEFRREVMELREEVGELVAEVHSALHSESVLRANDVDALRRAFDARTGHLA